MKLRTERIWRSIAIRVFLGRVGAAGELQASIRFGFVQYRETDRSLRVGPVLSRSWEIENRVDSEEDCN